MKTLTLEDKSMDSYIFHCEETDERFCMSGKLLAAMELTAEHLRIGDRIHVNANASPPRRHLAQELINAAKRNPRAVAEYAVSYLRDALYHNKLTTGGVELSVGCVEAIKVALEIVSQKKSQSIYREGDPAVQRVGDHIEFDVSAPVPHVEPPRPFRTQVLEEIQRWKKDPHYIPILPATVSLMDVLSGISVLVDEATKPHAVPGAMTVDITPDGIVFVRVDGEPIGRIHNLELKLAGAFTASGEAVIYSYPGSEVHVERLKKVPWLKVETKEL